MKHYKAVLKEANSSIDKIIKLEISFADEQVKNHTKMKDAGMIDWWRNVKTYLSSFLKNLDIDKVKKDSLGENDAERYAAKIILSQYKEDTGI